MASGTWTTFRSRLIDAWHADGGTPAVRAALVGGAARLGDPGWDGPVAELPGSVPSDMVGPGLPGLVLEALVAPDDRRGRGVHHTPPAVARAVVELALADRATPCSVVDPSVGGGAFLLAAADALLARGVPAAEVVAGLHGVDVDPLAAATARSAVRWWANDNGIDPGTVAAGCVLAGDGLSAMPADLGVAGFDLVVGNPPFLGQMAASTARTGPQRRQAEVRFGAAARGYVDTAGLFLLAALDLAGPGGRIALVLPEPFLGTRDARTIRDEVADRAALTDVWVLGRRVFEADVRVCVPVLTVGRTSDRSPVVHTGLPPRPRGRSVGGGSPWDGAVAVAHGVPGVRARSAGTLRDLATATAGFRQHFYGIVPHVHEAGDPATDRAPLVTSGAVDPASVLWGRRQVRFAGRAWQRPVVDLDGLGDVPDVAEWVRARLRPKVLVATQTRVIEAAADPAGRFVPSVPVISVEPHQVDDVWLVTAALLAPVSTAWALHRAGGTARTSDALKLSARQVLEVPLPADEQPWREAAAGLAAGALDADAFAALMAHAYRLAAGDPVTAWWRDRLPGWPSDEEGRAA